VQLHVYHCGKSSKLKATNTLLRCMGAGAFHCGVEVHGCEWSYESTGVFCCEPRHSPNHRYSETLLQGDSNSNFREVLRLVDVLRFTDWGDNTYDILEHNCCHFCDILCKRLGVEGTPPWVTNLALVGSNVRGAIRCVEKRATCCRTCTSTGLDKSAQGDLAEGTVEEGVEEIIWEKPTLLTGYKWDEVPVFDVRRNGEHLCKKEDMRQFCPSAQRSASREVTTHSVGGDGRSKVARPLAKAGATCVESSRCLSLAEVRVRKRTNN